MSWTATTLDELHFPRDRWPEYINVAVHSDDEEWRKYAPVDAYEQRIADLEQLVRDMYANLGCPDSPCQRCVRGGMFDVCDIPERIRELGIDVSE